MYTYIPIFFIGLSLSMDAFSLALVYGMLGLSKKDKIILSLIVAIYHFFMPLIGLTIGNLLTNIENINIDLIASVILIFIGIELIVSKYNKKNDRLTLNIVGFLLFGMSVSLDSLSIGISLKAITNLYCISFITFATLSGIFTYIGLILGNKVGSKLGSYSKMIGGLILLVIGIIIFIT